MFPSKDRLTICFAHVAYQMRERFLLRQTGVNSFNVRAADEFERRIGEADAAHRLRFIQSIGAGTDQFDREKLKRRGIRLASAQGLNMRAVSEHAMALILAITRRIRRSAPPALLAAVSTEERIFSRRLGCSSHSLSRLGEPWSRSRSTVAPSLAPGP